MQTSYPTAMDPGFSGQLYDLDSGKYARPMLQNEASATIPFGALVAKDADGKFGLLDTETAEIAGILLHSHHYDPGVDIDATSGELKPKTMGSVLDHGNAYALPLEEDMTTSDRVYARFAGTGTKGALRKTPVVGETIDVTGIVRLLTAGSTGDVVPVRIDVQNLS